MQTLSNQPKNFVLIALFMCLFGMCQPTLALPSGKPTKSVQTSELIPFADLKRYVPYTPQRVGNAEFVEREMEIHFREDFSKGFVKVDSKEAWALLPVPATDDRQKIEVVEVRSGNTVYRAKEDIDRFIRFGTGSQKALLFLIQRESPKVEVVFRAKMRVMHFLTPPEEWQSNNSLRDEELQQYLYPLVGDSTSRDINQLAFQSSLDATGMRRRPDENTLSFCRRLSLWFKGNFRYVLDHGDTPSLAEVMSRQTGNCNPLNILMSGILRANGVPARTGGCMLLKSDGTVGYHLRTQAYTPENGWITMDGSFMLNSKWDFHDSVNMFGMVPLDNDYDLGVVYDLRQDKLGQPKDFRGGSAFYMILSGKGVVFFSNPIQVSFNQIGSTKIGRILKGKVTTRVQPQTLDTATSTHSSASFEATSKVTSLVPVSTHGWSSFNFDGGQGSIQTTPEGETIITTMKVGTNRWSNQASIVSSEIKDGETYILKFSAKADKPVQVRVVGEQNQVPYQSIGLEPTELRLSSEYRPYEFKFTARNATGKSTKALSFQFGGANGTPGVVFVKDASIAHTIIKNIIK